VSFAISFLLAVESRQNRKYSTELRTVLIRACFLLVQFEVSSSEFKL
jgi:CRISPR/Cas system-associated protein endoribonuclease Cas2